MSNYPKTPAEWLAVHGEAELKITASHLVGHPDLPQSVEYSAFFLTEEAAQVYAARFPKGAGLRVGTLSFGSGQRLAMVSARVKLFADGVNGGRNETGIKRFRQVLATATKQNLPIRYDGTAFKNSVPSLDELLALLEVSA